MPVPGVRSRKAWHGRAPRVAAVLGMLVTPLAVAGVTAVPAAAATAYEVTATVGVGSLPSRVGVDPATDTVYVTNEQSNSVSVIDGATDTVTATIGVGSLPNGVGVDPATDTVYVANYGSGTVSVIDGATDTVTATIGVGSSPEGVGIDPATDTVYVANAADAQGSTVSVIDGATNTVTATVGVGSFPIGVAVDSSTHTVYVTNEDSSTVSVIDGAANTVTATIGVGGDPVEVGVDSSTHTAYVVNEGSNSVSVIDGAANRVTATVGVRSEPFGVAVDSATQTIYVSTRQNNSVSVIDGAANTVTATVGVGSDPAGEGVDPATHTVFVTNDGSDTVSVITPPQPGPASVTATPRNTAAAVSWTAPAYLVNGATVTGYTATASPGGETCSTTGATSCTITGLTNDTTYSIAVIAHTTAGDSAAQTEGVDVVPWGPTCPCSLWPSTAQPSVASASETSPVNLGVQFTPSVNGWISGIRFYKGPGNTGTHTGELWTASGTLLGEVTFTGESASGWQEADFSSPIAVTAGSTYVASYFAPNGGYSYDPAYFANTGVTNGPLTAPQSSAVTGGNGVYNYSGSPSFPASTYRAANYWVDVMFTRADSTPAVTGSTPDSGSPGNPVTATPTVTFSQPVVPGTVSFTVKDPGADNVAGAVSLNADDTVATFTPTSSLAGGTTYTVTVSGAQTPSGTAMASPYSWTFTTAGSQCPCSLWPSTAQPAVASANDSTAVNLGVQFTPASDGWIAGIRFYKGAGNTGAHAGELWTAGGTLLGKVTFTGESESGWQEADFSSPIAVTAGTTYVASYFAPDGGYAYTAGGFNSAVTNGPLTAPTSSAVSGGNGVYNYGGSPSFPDATSGAANYWVDVDFTMSPGAFAPTAAGSTPGNGSAGNPVTVAPTATFSQAVVPGSVSFTVKDSGGNTVAGAVSFNADDTVATFTPANPLAGNTTYIATVSGARNSSGTPMSSPDSWTFSTAGSQCPCTLWPPTATPSVASANDPGAVNLGVQFTPSVNGWISGIRFYKGAGNTGAHTGDLWTASGTLLGQVTFTGESASGWQEADFASPIAVTAGTTYVASYFAPNGGYSADPASFASTGVTSGPLTAPQSSAVTLGNGLYAYGGSPVFPGNTYNATNYWVDVVFTQP